MIDIQDTAKLTPHFYQQKAKTVAKNLLGKILVRSFLGQHLAGKIVETEAYLSENDEASHSYSGLSKRNKTMFNVGGFLYVYQIYGIHFCCNVVTGKKDVGEAVLIRAIEPIINIDLMGKNRFNKALLSQANLISISNGPAKLCEALSISKSDDGTNLSQKKIYLLDSPNIHSNKIINTTRIGISKSKELPLRFYIKDNPFVSKK